MLSEQAIIEWMQIYKKRTGKEIDFEDAKERANRMFRFLKIITKPKHLKVNACSQD